ncbi:MAG: hypothetical protein WCO37_00440 [Bacteroidota bacterium]|jgi:hypothetical protein
MKDSTKYSISPRSGRLRKKIKLNDFKNRDDFDNSKRNHRIVVVSIILIMIIALYFFYDFMSSSTHQQKIINTKN